MRFGSKACPKTNRPRAWQPMSPPIASACWSRPPARCSWSALSKAPGFPRSAAWTWGYVHGGDGADRHRHRAGRPPNPNNRYAPKKPRGPRAVCARRECRDRRILRVSRGKMPRRRWPSSYCSSSPTRFSGAMTAPFMIDLGFTRNEYAAIVKGVGLAATLIGGFAGGFVARALSAGDEPVDRRRLAGGRQPAFSWLALVGGNHGRWRSRSRWRISPARSVR